MTAHLLWSTLFAAAALAAVLALRRRSAALRHAILLAALLRFAVPTGWLLQTGELAAHRLRAPAPVPRTLVEDMSWLLLTPGARDLHPLPPPAFTLADAARLLWILGALLCIATWIRRLARSVPAVRDPDEQEAEAFRAARARCSGAAAVGLRIADCDHGPAARGWLRPTIVLPDGLSTELSAEELEAVLLHELAHVGRRDNLSAAVARMIVSVFWFHPLLWWIERRMLAERERACDDLVLLSGARPDDYATGLLKVCRMAFTGPAVYAEATGSDLKSRMEHIMSANANRSSRTLRAAFCALVLTAMLIPTAGGFLQAQPSAAHLKAGDEQLRLKNYDGALREYRLGLEADPGQAGVYRKRIVETLTRQGKHADAAALNREILAANPADTDARTFAAAQGIDKDGCTQAIAELRAILIEAPANFVAAVDLGHAQIVCGDAAAARKTLEEVVRLHPDFVRGWLELAKVQAQQGDYDASLKSVAQVLKIDPANASAGFLQAAALTGKKQFDDARAVLQEILRSDPNSADATFQMGTTWLAERKYAQAEEAFRRTRQLEPSNLRGTMGIVEVYLAQNRADEAIALLQAELAKAPASTELHIALGNTYVRAGRYDQAISKFQIALNAVGKNSKAAVDVYLRMGETYRRKGDLGSAAETLEQARALAPQNVMIVSTLALTLDVAGKKEEARHAYEDVLQLDPRNGVALNNLAYLLSESGGDLDQALVLARRAQELMPTLYEVRDTEGWIYLKKNQSDEAIAIFTDLVRQQPSHSTWHYHLAMALLQRGDRAAAVRELDDALKNNPPAAERQKIEELKTSIR